MPPESVSIVGGDSRTEGPAPQGGDSPHMGSDGIGATEGGSNPSKRARQAKCERGVRHQCESLQARQAGKRESK